VANLLDLPTPCGLKLRACSFGPARRRGVDRKRGRRASAGVRMIFVPAWLSALAIYNQSDPSLTTGLAARWLRKLFNF
jgi:hypothetical protein